MGTKVNDTVIAMCFFQAPMWHWKMTKAPRVAGVISNKVTVVTERGRERTVHVDVPSEFYKFYWDVLDQGDDATDVQFRVIEDQKRWYLMVDSHKKVGVVSMPLWYWIPSNRPRWLSNK